MKNEASKGLWHNIRAKKARGEKPARKGSKAYKSAVKAAKKINANESVLFQSESLRLEIIEHSEPVIFQEAEYDGRTVKLNKIMQGDVKKFKVHVNSGKKNADGTIRVKKVNFGQKGMKIKKNNPERRKSFRARHKCDSPGPKTSARYWSCRKW
jgi:hypothetical protein|tara:strand:+ start:6116 stop:6577 length:462 start_codon:yes stop_codon:yes gene_type:complete